ncbi:MAG: thiol-disulfide isomerase [Acidobacteria bacterium]|nr:thiol-disulfide isomerase [Acidobacteriota bacterium]
MNRVPIYLRSTFFVVAALVVAAPAVAGEPGEETPTFSDDVFPILRANCQNCHRPGEVAPMSLLTFRQTRPWAKAIRRNVLARTMPPWNAEPGVGPKFHNDRSLSQDEIDTIVAWVDAGAPRGDAEADLEIDDYTDGWQTTPEEIIEIPPFEVPAKGTLDYTYYIVPGATTEDRWVTAAELRPSNRELTHHLIAYIRPPGSNYLREYPVGEFFVPEAEHGECSTCRDGEPRPASEFEFLIGYAPGFNPYEGPVNDQRARLIPAGSDVIFELHYSTTGEAGVDQAKLGLSFAKARPAERLFTTSASNGGFEIPPGAKSHRVDAVATTNHPLTLHALTPHMHLRGSAFRYDLVFPDGTRQELLNVPEYDFNWQLSYFLDEPIELPTGTRIEATAHFDNSADNPFNPAPEQTVRWGDQSWEEMMVGFFDISFDSALDPGDMVVHGERASRRVTERITEASAERQ